MYFHSLSLSRRFIYTLYQSPKMLLFDILVFFSFSSVMWKTLKFVKYKIWAKVGSTVTSQLQGHRFNPELRLVSVSFTTCSPFVCMCFLQVIWFPLTVQKHAGRWECVNFCVNSIPMD